MSKIRTIYTVLKSKGAIEVVQLFKNKIFPSKVKSIKRFDTYLSYFKDKKGIEIGGPSRILSEEIPIYSVIEILDGCNFSNQTVWEGNIVDGNNYNFFNNKKGIQYICEASDLEIIPSKRYDFLIASHCLEHCANTLKTIEEWLRIIKKGGSILLVLPDRKYTFDHNRPITKFDHLIDDYKNDLKETDLYHLEEILELHDLNMDKPAGTKNQFKMRSLDNFSNRCLHHHVFDFDLLKLIYEHYGIKILDMTFVKPYHQIILGIKQ